MESGSFDPGSFDPGSFDPGSFDLGDAPPSTHPTTLTGCAIVVRSGVDLNGSLMLRLNGSLEVIF